MTKNKDANGLVAELEALAGPPKSAAHAARRARLAAYVAAKPTPPPPVVVPVGWTSLVAGAWALLTNKGQ